MKSSTAADDVEQLQLCAPIASTSRGEAPASRKSRFTTSATNRPSIRVSRSSPCG
jgi:hypothetical protein